jgi:hypothetical protein
LFSFLSFQLGTDPKLEDIMWAALTDQVSFNFILNHGHPGGGGGVKYVHNFKIYLMKITDRLNNSTSFRT